MAGQSDRPVESLPRFEWDRVANVKLEVKDHFDADFDDPIHLWYVSLSLNIEWNGAVLEAGRVRKRRGTAGSLTMLAFSLAVRGCHRKTALEQEQANSRAYFHIMRLAKDEKDYVTEQLIQSYYIPEQVCVRSL